MSGVIGAWLEREVAARTLSTPLEGSAVLAGLLGALTGGVALFLLLRKIPRVLLTLRLKGVVSANAAGDTIALTIGIGMLLGIGLGLIVELTGNLSDLARSIVIATAGTLGYALPRLWLMRPAPHADPCLWLVLAHPNTVPNWPQLVDRITRSHRVGPLTLVSPPNAVPFGEHLHLADRLGMLDSLFPRLEIEVRDWQRALPPADRWSGVVHRQVHPPVALMPMLLDSYLGPLDQVLLIASCEDDVQIWRGRLPVDRTRVLWVSPQGKGQAGARPDRVAGYPVIVMDAKTRGRINMQGWFSSQDKQEIEDKAARTLQEEELEVNRRILGDEHPDTLTSMNNLASTLNNEGDLSNARVLQEEVLGTRRRVLGEEHPDTLTSMSNLADTLLSQGDLPGARALLEEVQEVSRRVLGEEHPATLIRMGNLALTLLNQGDLPGARALLERVRVIRRRDLGEEHPDTLAVMQNLANTLWQMNEHQPALQLMQTTADSRERVLGRDHPDTLDSQQSVEKMRATIGQMEKAS